jgi:hypothetical protein
MKFFGCAVAAFLLAVLLPAPSRAQAPPQPQGKNRPPVPPPDFSTKYDRTPAGMIVQFQTIMSSSKDPDKAKLLVQELEIPKYDEYFDKVYQNDVKLFWTGSYTRALLKAAGNFQSLFARLAMQQGEFDIRKINDAPASKFEEVLTSKMNGPVDIYAVSWKKRNAKDDSDADLFGYYAYYGNRFRWFYMLDFPKIPGETSQGARKPAGEASKKSSAGTSSAPAAQPNSAPPSAPNQYERIP